MMNVVSLHAHSSCLRRNSTCCTKFPPKGKKCGTAAGSGRGSSQIHEIFCGNLYPHFCGNFDKENIWTLWGKMINHGIMPLWFLVCNNLGSVAFCSSSFLLFCWLEKCQQNWPWRIALLCDFLYDSSVFSSGPWHIKMRSDEKGSLLTTWKTTLWTALHRKTPSFQFSGTDSSSGNFLNNSIQ